MMKERENAQCSILKEERNMGCEKGSQIEGLKRFSRLLYA
jgi:hypothetical protein